MSIHISWLPSDLPVVQNEISIRYYVTVNSSKGWTYIDGDKTSNTTYIFNFPPNATSCEEYQVKIDTENGPSRDPVPGESNSTFIYAYQRKFKFFHQGCNDIYVKRK